jgi:hypothetical protein
VAHHSDVPVACRFSWLGGEIYCMASMICLVKRGRLSTARVKKTTRRIIQLDNWIVSVVIKVI